MVNIAFASRTLTLGVAAALLAACAVGPNYVRPNIETPSKFVRDEAASDARAADIVTGVEQNAAPAPSPQADAEFWRSFNDPLLTRLVEDALARTTTCASRWPATTAPTRCFAMRSSTVSRR